MKNYICILALMLISTFAFASIEVEVVNSEVEVENVVDVDSNLNIDIKNLESVDRFFNNKLGWCWNITYSCGATETLCEWQLQGGSWSTFELVMLIWESDYYICG